MDKFAVYRATMMDTTPGTPDLFVNNDYLTEARKVFRRIIDFSASIGSMSVAKDEINGRRETVVYYGVSPVASRNAGPPEEITFYDTPAFRALGLEASAPQSSPFIDDVRQYEIPT